MVANNLPSYQMKIAATLDTNLFSSDLSTSFQTSRRAMEAFFIYKFNIQIYNLRITDDYERSTIQYHKTIPRGAKDHDYPRAIHMKNINLKLQLNKQLRETITKKEALQCGRKVNSCNSLRREQRLVDFTTVTLLSPPSPYFCPLLIFVDI